MVKNRTRNNPSLNFFKKVDPKTTFSQAYGEGYFRGKANAILKKFSQNTLIWQTHMFFIKSGAACAYSPLDEAIEHTLRSMVSQLTVSDRHQNFASMVKETRPDCVFVLMLPDRIDNFLHQMQEVRQSNIPMAGWMVDDPYYTDETFYLANYFDYIFTSDSSCVEMYRKQGCSAHWLPLGAFVPHYYPLNKRCSVRRDIGFIGVAFPDRINFFDAIIPQLMHKNTLIQGCKWKKSKQYKRYKDQFHTFNYNEWLSSEQMNEHYNGTKIFLNLHRSIFDSVINRNETLKLPALSPNPRTFEICAAGGFQLTDVRADLCKLYTSGVEIETYTCREELLHKVDYYLAHEEERQNIALRGLARTLQSHTYEHRMNTILEIIFPPDQKRSQ